MFTKLRKTGHGAPHCEIRSHPSLGLVSATTLASHSTFSTCSLEYKTGSQKNNQLELKLGRVCACSACMACWAWKSIQKSYRAALQPLKQHFPLNSRGQSQTHFGAQFWGGLTVGTIVTFMGLDSAILDLLWAVIWVLFAFPGCTLHPNSWSAQKILNLFPC